MKKTLLISVVLITMFVAFFMLLRSDSINGEEGVEKSLVNSMDESKVEMLI